MNLILLYYPYVKCTKILIVLKVSKLMLLSFPRDKIEQTVQTQIRLVIEEQSDQGLHYLLFFLHYLCLVMRKPAFYICENEGADQLRGNREADQRLCF